MIRRAIFLKKKRSGADSQNINISRWNASWSECQFESTKPITNALPKVPRLICRKTKIFVHRAELSEISSFVHYATPSEVGIRYLRYPKGYKSSRRYPSASYRWCNIDQVPPSCLYVIYFFFLILRLITRFFWIRVWTIRHFPSLIKTPLMFGFRV